MPDAELDQQQVFIEDVLIDLYRPRAGPMSIAAVPLDFCQNS